MNVFIFKSSVGAFPMPTVEGAELVKECYGFYSCSMSFHVAAEVESWWKLLKQIFNFFSIIPSCCECSVSSSHCDALAKLRRGISNLNFSFLFNHGNPAKPVERDV